jgi:hexosaminidase
VYAFDPDRHLPAEALAATRGIQATLWTHFIGSGDEMLYKFSPRVCALAEIGWTPRRYREWTRFHSALLEVHYSRLVGSGARPASMDPYPFAAWTAADVGRNWAVVGWNAIAAFSAPGKYLVQFHTTYGDTIEIRNVGVTDAAGEWLCIDTHVAAAGISTYRTIYHLEIGNARRAAALRAEMRIPNGVSSEGEVYIDLAIE